MFITLEGIEGSGKPARLKKWLFFWKIEDIRTC